MDRRQFIKNSSLLLAASSGLAMSRSEQFTLLIPSQYSGSSSLRYPNFFHYFDFASMSHNFMKIPLAYSHSAFSVGEKYRCLVVEKDGPFGCLINLKTKKVDAILKATPGHVFSGHVLIDPLQDLLITTEFDYPNSNKVVFRKLSNFSVQSEMNSPSLRPHEMQWVGDDNGRFVMGHYGMFSEDKTTDIKGEVSFIDSKNRKVIQRFRPENKNAMPCHVAVVDKNTVVTGTLNMVSRTPGMSKMLAARLNDYENSKHKPLNEKKFFELFKLLPCPLYAIDLSSGKMKTLSDKGINEHLKWNLTVKVDKEKSILAVTHVYGHKVSFWDADSMKLINNIDVQFPTGVHLHENQWIVIGSDGQLVFVDRNTFKVTQRHKSPSYIGAASHISLV